MASPFEDYSQWTDMATLTVCLSVTCFIIIMVLIFWLFSREQKARERVTQWPRVRQRNLGGRLPFPARVSFERHGIV